MHVTAIVPAGGGGRRMGAALPKQFLLLRGRPLLLWTLEALLASPRIGHLIVAVPPGTEAQVAAEVLAPAGVRVDTLVSGGAERQDSVRAGLAAAPPETDLILVHDAARPLITPAILEAALDAAAAVGGAVVAVPVTDTIKRAAADGRVDETLARGRLWAAQTPQIFRADWFRSAHARAAADGFLGTDDSALVERMGYPVALVPGSPENLKITVGADLDAAEQILRRRAEGA
jgi:2-C-methyl-D-erythritol 4-phosphate cytidylyltransferase